MNKHFTLTGWKMICCVLFSVLFFSSSLSAQSEIATRDIINTTRCDNGSTNSAGYIYGLYILIEGEDRLHTFQSGTFTEYDNGTASLTGAVVNNTNSDIQFNVDIDFTGRTFSAPTDSPKLHNCFNPSSSDWYYYTGLSGTLEGSGASLGTTIDILGNSGPAYQIGTGANVTSNGTNFGACGWLSMSVSNQSITGPQIIITTSSAGTNGDINIDLSGAPLSPPLPCDNVTDGGTIGSDQTLCSGETATLSGTSPSGGSGEIEYLWLSSTVECPTQLSQEIEGATSATYNPGILTETTYFVRCSRRAGCDSWGFGESNCVTIEVIDAPEVTLSNNNPTCGNNDGSISFAFDDNSGRTNIEFSLDGGDNYDLNVLDNVGTTSYDNLAAGTYAVFVRWGNDDCPVDLGSVTLTDDSQTVGTTCNDGNDNTFNDVIQADGCSCAGTPANDSCNKYQITDSTPECGSALEDIESGVFYQRDCGETFTVWQAGSDLMLTENGDGTATIAGTILNNGNTASVFINLAGYSTTGENWALECYDSNLAPQYFYTSFSGTIVEEGDIAYTIEQKASGVDFVFGAGANNQTDGSLGLGGWTTGTWGTCIEVFASLTPLNAGDTCDDSNANTSNDVILADGCSCAGTIDPIIVDNDNDGVPANEDCDDNDPSIPATVGSTCNDGNDTTNNDVIQADGCSCAGTPDNGNTPDCNDITISAGEGTVVISGLDGAPVTSVQVFNSAWQQEFACFADCNTPTQIIPVAAGEYLVYVKYYTANYALVCEENATITVGGGGPVIIDNDNDGFPANEDCDDNDPSVPATVGSTCDDGNDTTSNDVIMADGCTCVGTPDGGGIVDNDNDGVPADLDCNDNDPSIPAAVGSTCNDGNGNTTNDIIQADGCTCAGTVDNGGGTPDCANIGITSANGNIVITGLDGAPVTSIQVFNMDWVGTFSCFADCNSPMETIPAADGEYLIYVKYYTVNYALVCEESTTITVGDGGTGIVDNDNDGVPAIEDCDDNDPSIPATVGSTCNDGNGATSNDVIQADGCTCAGTPDGGGSEGVDLALFVTGNGDGVGAYQGFSTTFTITNEGTSASDNVVVNIPQPQGVVFEGNNPFNASAGDYDYYSTFNWSVGTLAPGQTETITLNYYTIGSAPYTVYGQVTNASGTDADSTPGNGTAPTPNEDDEAVYNTGDGGTGIVDNDNDGVPVGEDCDDNDPSVPAAVGSTCNDGNANTSGDIILADGCSCEGTPNGGGLTDNDNDGVPADEDCDDNDPSVPATVGSTCNDGNANTSDDVILADGCSCAGTPIGTDNCDDILISEEDGMISIGGLDNAPLTAVWVFDAGWNTVFNCSYGCDALETYQATAGTYSVIVKKLNADWSVICEVERQITVAGTPQNDILTLTQPDNQTVDAAPGASSAIVTYDEPVANTTCADNGLDLVRTAGPASGSVFPIGTTTITYQATDACGNTETVSFTITVTAQDSNLTLTGPDNQTVDVAPGVTTAVVTYPTPVANTTCADGGLELVRIAGPASGSAFPIGTTTITYQATDNCGNSETVSFTITVVASDSVVTISCPANVVADTAPGATSAIVTYGNATATTNCEQGDLNVSVTEGPASGSAFVVGTTTVKYTATDACGGMEMCTFTVTVNAVAAPDCEITRSATNATQCVNGENYGIYIQGDFYTISQGSLTEYSNGTAILAGTANGFGDIHIEFTGRTNNLTPLFGNCFTPATTDWYYYTAFSGTIGSLNVEGNPAHPFQIGKGANNQNQNDFGGSGWWNASNGQTGDINLRLSGNAGTLQFDDSCEQPVAGCDLDILFVVGDTNLNAGDAAISNRLMTQGYNVMTVDAQWAETSDANGKDLVFISSTVLSTDLGATFKNVSVPVIISEAFLLDDMALTGNASGTDYSTQSGVQSYTATNHPINGDLSGTFNVFTSVDDVNWGYPYAVSNDAGYIPSNPNKCMIIAYNEDDAMFGNFHAPARRVGFFLRDNSATKLTAKGWQLFDQSIQWATNCTPANGTVVQSIEDTTNDVVIAEERTSEEAVNIAFGIYPNPATDMVNVSLVEMNGAAVIINVYDALGRNIERIEADAAYNSVYRINTSDYKSGMYMISVQAGDAPAITKQLVILGH